MSDDGYGDDGYSDGSYDGYASGNSGEMTRLQPEDTAFAKNIDWLENQGTRFTMDLMDFVQRPRVPPEGSRLPRVLWKEVWGTETISRRPKATFKARKKAAPLTRFIKLIMKTRKSMPPTMDFYGISKHLQRLADEEPPADPKTREWRAPFFAVADIHDDDWEAFPRTYASAAAQRNLIKRVKQEVLASSLKAKAEAEKRRRAAQKKKRKERRRLGA